MPQDITAQSSHLNFLRNFPLPLDIVSFTGSATKNFISLEWTTSTELNNKGFEIQQKIVDQQSSINEDDFINIGFIEGKANSAQNTNYKFKDHVKKIGNYYYRIKQIDYDGSFKYSKEVIVNVTAIANEIYTHIKNYPESI